VGGVEVGGEVGVLAPRQEDVGVVGAAVGVQAVQGRRRGGQVARHEGAVRQPGAQPPDLRRFGPGERVPVGRPGHRVADRGEQVGAQRQRPGPVGPAGVRPGRLHQRQRVPVGTHAGGSLGRPHQVRHGVRGRAGPDQVVADAGGRGVQLDQPPRGVAVHLAAPVRRDLLDERVPDEAVAEAVARAGGLDDPRGQRGVEVAEGLLLGQPGQGDELVGVERRPGYRHPLEDVARGRTQAAEHARPERLGPILPASRVRPGCGPAGQLGHKERDAPAQRRDQPDQVGRGVGEVTADERRGVAIAERAQAELGRAVPVDEAPEDVRQRAGRRNRAVREDDAHRLIAG
jgi:hypothetical protein